MSFNFCFYEYLHYNNIFFYRLRKIKSARSVAPTTYLVYVYIFTYTIHDFTSCENGRGDIDKKKKKKAKKLPTKKIFIAFLLMKIVTKIYVGNLE